MAHFHHLIRKYHLAGAVLLLGCVVCTQSLAVPAGAEVDCVSPNQWNATAMKLFEKGKYRDAINSTENAECKWKDYNILFASYMALYLQHPMPATRSNALHTIADFRSLHNIDGSADPGPLYVALGDIAGAKQWYQTVVANIRPNYSGNNKITINNMRRAAIAALKLLNSRNWHPSERVQLLKLMAEAIDASVDQASKKHR